MNPSWKNWDSYMKKRKRTEETIRDTIEDGKRHSHSGDNYLNPGNSMKRIESQSGKSLVIDDVTKEIIMLGGEGFKY